MTASRSPPLFVYGTLLNDEVVCALIGRTPASTAARVRGYVRRRVRDEVYPAAIKAHGGILNGRLLFDLTSAERDAIDLFEGVEYTMARVISELNDHEAVRPTTTAILYAAAPALIASGNIDPDAEWDLDWFQDHDCADLLAAIRRGGN